MKEDFLHYVWKHNLFASTNLKTTRNESLEILKLGTHNFHSGPDFLDASLKIDGQEWFGNIEIHVNASDWYVHHHERDAKYDAVILHVVWEEDVLIYTKSNLILPTLTLKNKVDCNLLERYGVLVKPNTTWIPCENEINTTSALVFEHWKERLFFERLEKKATEIQLILAQRNVDFEATLFALLCKNFGLKINGVAFLQLANSFDFKILKKVRSNSLQLAALLFGQAGFLDRVVEESYYMQLQNEYEFLQMKFNLVPIVKEHFSFFRMRPTNFPTIRIAQLVALYHRHEHFFLTLLELQTKKEFYSFFKVELDLFWENHFTFEKISPKKSIKRISTAFVDLVLINTIIPVKYSYQKIRGEIFENEYLDLLEDIRPEKNRIVNRFTSLGIESKNAFDTQALLQLKNEYCTRKKCLRCAVGKNILRV